MKGMITLAAVGMLCCTLPGLTTSTLTSASDATQSQASTGTVSVLCEVWKVSDEALRDRIEVLSEEVPMDARAVRSLVQGAEGGTRRLARVVTTVAEGTQLRFVDEHAVPFVSTSQGQNSSMTTFGGTSEAGTMISIACSSAGGEAIDTRIELEMSAFAESGRVDPRIPPPAQEFRLERVGRAPSGQLQMFQSDSDQSGILILFLRATST